MSDQKKPSFLDGLMSGFEPKSSPEESKQLTQLKEHIALNYPDLSTEERIALVGWLLGEAFKSAVTSMLGDKPSSSDSHDPLPPSPIDP